MSGLELSAWDPGPKFQEVCLGSTAMVRYDMRFPEQKYEFSRMAQALPLAQQTYPRGNA